VLQSVFMGINSRIREAITASGKSKAEIARACGVTNAAVTHWFNGDTKSLKAETALALEAATGYRAAWILYGRGSKKIGDLYWPFSIDVDRFTKLTEKDRGIAEGKLEAAIEACEQRSHGERLLEETDVLNQGTTAEGESHKAA
jgi:transcriptional regulator with XRE-family HTH domain